jgi:hypothetical protein
MPHDVSLPLRAVEMTEALARETAGWHYGAVIQEVTRLGPGEFAVMERHVGENDRA